MPFAVLDWNNSSMYYVELEELEEATPPVLDSILAILPETKPRPAYLIAPHTRPWGREGTWKFDEELGPDEMFDWVYDLYISPDVCRKFAEILYNVRARKEKEVFVLTDTFSLGSILNGVVWIAWM